MSEPNLLLHVTNLSISQGTFPRELKIAKVLPLYKAKDKMFISNYRPVSILPIFSKIYERIMYKRLLSFLNKHNILYQYQFGFRENHGVNSALIYMIDKILKSLDKGEIVVGLFLDFCKAFDTVDHQILINKMNKYGIRGTALEWIKSYLSERKQFVYFNGINSSEQNIVCGIPQGSILGPLFFLIYINDIARVSKLLFFLLFADDTNIFITGKDINTITHTLNQELKKLLIWLQVNKLSINIDKTKYIIFSLRKKVNTVSHIYINNNIIERVYSTKFLGIIIDSKLSWIDHVQHIKTKIAKGLGILCKSRKILNINTLLTLYYSFVFPYIVYCIEVWGSVNKLLFSSIFKLQKRAVRIIVSANYRAHTDPIFTKLKILPLHKVYQMRVLIFMFKFSNNTLPNIFTKMFQVNVNIHHYSTRQSYKLHVMKCKTSALLNSMSYQGTLLWNYMSDTVNTHCSIQTFQWHLKKFMLDHDIHLS